MANMFVHYKQWQLSCANGNITNVLMLYNDRYLFYFIYLLIFFRFFVSEAKMSKERTLQIIYCKEKARIIRRSKHKYVMSMSSRTQMSSTSYRLRCYRWKELYRRIHSYLQWLLYTALDIEI